VDFTSTFLSSNIANNLPPAFMNYTGPTSEKELYHRKPSTLAMAGKKISNLATEFFSVPVEELKIGSGDESRKCLMCIVGMLEIISSIGPSYYSKLK
jgi:hypothetical protein